MSTQAVIFDVQRSCFHDGPGIRTTVFFKGCPLRCLWCHNPESLSGRPQLSFNRDKCADCMACAERCATGAHKAQAGRHWVDRNVCQACGRCVEMCPAGALKVVGEPRDVAGLVAEVERDRKFYETSGGGVTLSGGEPLAQFEFCMELLHALRQAGIHTCMETSGFAPAENIDRAAGLVDLFLFDFKAGDCDLHKRLTGVSNELILANLDRLMSRGARVLLRCPLVPGVNDSRDCLAAIAALAAKYPALVGVEIMAYHNIGRGKAQQVGLEEQLPDLPTTDEPTRAGYLKTLRDMGCANVTLG